MTRPAIPYARWRGARLYLNLPIPADLRPYFRTAAGKDQTHVVESLGTGDPVKGRRLARERQAYWVLEFAKLRRGHAGELPSTIRKIRELREAMIQAQGQDSGEAVEVIEGLASDQAEEIEASAGLEAAQQFYRMATRPDRLTLREAVAKMNESQDVGESTKAKRGLYLRELLGFLQLEDCLPESVTEARAVAYVDWLNAGTLGYSTKQDRLSGLQSIWRFLARKRQIPASATPWRDHELTGKARPGAGEEGKRGWRTAEILTLFNAPDHGRANHYTRGLFLELYALGFITGMRLDEVVSLQPRAVEEIPGGLLVRVEESKTEAGVRSMPVVHPVAVAILRRRVEAQTDPAKSIFPECRPGGYDNKPSWHVQKALGRDRDRLGFGPSVDFHSTRRSFMTLMEQAGASVVHVQRYVGHRVPTMMHSVYSDGASLDNLRRVAEAVQYPPEVEEAFRRCLAV